MGASVRWVGACLLAASAASACVPYGARGPPSSRRRWAPDAHRPGVLTDENRFVFFHELTHDRVPGELLVHHVTSTFVTVLNWWVESGGKLSPSEVDEVFLALVLPSLSAALD